MLGIPKVGKKCKMIDRILLYVETGVVEENKTVPARSKAKRNSKEPLAPHSLMLHGYYKNESYRPRLARGLTAMSTLKGCQV